MNRKIIITLLIAVILAAAVLGGCEIFEGSPIRDNLNDPNCEADYNIDLSLIGGIDNIEVRWEKSGNIDYDFEYQIVYGTDPDVNSGSNEKLYVGGDQYNIGDLNYGTAYNIWLRGIERDSDENVIFSKYISGMPEARGDFDYDFANSGVFTVPYADTSAYDLVSFDDNSIIVAADYNFMGNQIFVRLAYDGLLLSGFGINGIYDPALSPVDIACAKMSNGDFIGFIRQTTFGDLYYFKNDEYTYSTTMSYAAAAACGMDNNYMSVTGTNGLDKFSVLVFDEYLMSTSVVEYSVDHNLFTYTVNTSRSNDVYYNNDRLYAAGWIESTTFDYYMHAVILDPDNINIPEYELVFNADWDPSELRIRTIGTTGPRVGPQIAADNDGNVFIAGCGILSKFRLNGSIYDMDEEWAEYGSVYLPEGFFPVDLIVQENGKVLLFVNKWMDIEMPTPTFDQSYVYRFNTDGTPDLNFGPDEKGNLELPDLITGADLKADGRIVVSANGGDGYVYQFE